MEIIKKIIKYLIVLIIISIYIYIGYLFVLSIYEYYFKYVKTEGTIVDHKQEVKYRLVEEEGVKKYEKYYVDYYLIRYYVKGDSRPYYKWREFLFPKKLNSIVILRYDPKNPKMIETTIIPTWILFFLYILIIPFLYILIMVILEW